MGKGWREAISGLSRGLQTITDTFLLIKQKSFSALQKGSASSSIPLSHPDVCPKTFVENGSPCTRGSAGRRAYKCSIMGRVGPGAPSDHRQSTQRTFMRHFSLTSNLLTYQEIHTREQPSPAKCIVSPPAPALTWSTACTLHSTGLKPHE